MLKMLHNNFVQILVRVLLILANCFLVAFLFYNSQSYVIIAHLFLLVFFQSWFLSRYLNKTNKDIFKLLEAYKNNDSVNLHSKNKVQNKIYNQLETLNKKLRLAEEELTKQLVYINAVAQNVPGGLITIFENEKIDLYSHSILEILNKKSIQSLDDFKEFPDLYKSIQAIKAGEKIVERINSDSGVKVWSLSCSVIKSESQKIKIISFDNIKSELDEQEIQSWQKLIRVLTHEMMNSFSPLISANETLKMLFSSMEFKVNKVINAKEIVKIEKIKKGIDLINNRSNGITGFIEKYRKISKLPKPNFQKYYISKLFEELAQLYETILNQNKIKFISEIYPDNLQIFADKEQVMQVLINLIKNSVEALENTADKQIILTAKLNTNNKVVISISDNGYGINNEDLPEIFIPFFTTKKNGSGIGLSLSKQIMNLHKGEIQFVQKEKQTEFTLTF